MPDQDNAIVKWIKGRRTYAVAFAIIGCGILDSQGVRVPVYVWAALAAFGLGFLRAGVSNEVNGN